MKLRKLFFQFLAFSVVISLSSCGGRNQQNVNKQSEMPAEHGAMSNQIAQENSGDMHKQHNSLAKNFEHQDIVILDQVYQPAEGTKAELEQVIGAYLQVKDALVKDDLVALDNAIDLMSEKVAAVVPTRMEGKGLEAWNNHQSLYAAKQKEMRHIKDLENKRFYFSHLSEIMYCTIKSFGLKQGHLFSIFCPMAFDGKGAYWISDSKVIQNPYLGTKMPTCGEVKEEL